jgi:hypothetical protein
VTCGIGGNDSCAFEKAPTERIGEPVPEAQHAALAASPGASRTARAKTDGGPGGRARTVHAVMAGG